MSLKVRKNLAIISFFLSIIFIVFALVFIFCTNLEDIKLDQPISYNFVVAIILLILWMISFIISVQSFCSYTCYFPLNEIKDYEIDFRLENIGEINDGKFVIKIEQIEKGVFQTVNGKNRLTFNLKGYLFAKSYLRSYFVRNFNYKQVNMQRLKIKRIMDNLKLSYLKHYSQVELVIDNKIYIIVKKNKTTHTALSAIITYSPFCLILIPPYIFRNRRLEKIEKFSEKHYNDYKIHNINKH